MLYTAVGQHSMLIGLKMKAQNTDTMRQHGSGNEGLFLAE